MRKELVSFALAGAVGFMVDAGVLYMALAAGSGPFWGRALSFASAVLTTWLINRTFTFSPPAGRAIVGEFARYLAAMAAGGLLNLATYGAVVIGCPPAPWIPLVAVAAGAAVGMVCNFVTARLWVFRAH
ncbi:polysaccharide synthesis protein GtrA [Luteibacter yeojuensis]|uniref:Polysaccharide synthesis protein GtrA n=1 Tax=Luteibacter yeojuensis TaxID=345309 RepID=A0A0F3KL42_9GAMM|nr:polysaccharide synthesis protein GtrA [Luteibacter yeojuensis]